MKKEAASCWGALSRARMLALCGVLLAMLLVTPRWAKSQPAAGPGTVSPALVEDLVAANRVLVDKGVIDIRGHVSVRHPGDPNRFLMSRAVAPELVMPGDILVHDLDGDVAGTRSGALFAERFIHSEIYRARPDVMAVVHAHTPSAVSFSVTDIPLRPVIISANFLGEGVPIFQNGEYGAGISRPELGQALVQKLGKGPAVLMRGHGMVVVGSSLSAAVGRSVYLDVNAQIQARALAMGAKLIYNLPPEKTVAALNPYDREWDAWKRKALMQLK